MDCRSAYEYGAVSSPGLLRDVNEDCLGFYQSGDAMLSVVADGMGGHRSGEVASRVCVETMRDIFLGGGADAPEAMLRKGLLQADAELLRRSAADRSLRGMGATVVAVILRGEECWFSHLGDSRIYLVEPDKVQRLTRDHTVPQELVELGLITEQQAVHHYLAHKVSKAVGHLPQGKEGIEVAKVSLRAESALLLCSDGLSDLVSDQEILCEVNGAAPQKACENLLALALARGGARQCDDSGDSPPAPPAAESRRRGSWSKSGFPIEPSGMTTFSVMPESFCRGSMLLRTQKGREEVRAGYFLLRQKLS